MLIFLFINTTVSRGSMCFYNLQKISTVLLSPHCSRENIDFQYNFVFIANKTLWSVHLGVDALGVCEVFYVY